MPRGHPLPATLTQLQALPPDQRNALLSQFIQNQRQQVQAGVAQSTNTFSSNTHNDNNTVDSNGLQLNSISLTNHLNTGTLVGPPLPGTNVLTGLSRNSGVTFEVMQSFLQRDGSG